MLRMFPLMEGNLKLVGIAALFALCNIDPFQSVSHSFSCYTGEFILGVTLGMPLYIVSKASRLLGTLIETVRGQNMGELINPFYQGGSQATSLLLEGYAITHLFILGFGVEVYCHFLRSLKVVGVGGVSTQFIQEKGVEVVALASSLFLPASVLFLLMATVLLAADVLHATMIKTVPSLTATNELYLLKFIISGSLVWSLLASHETPLRLILFVLRCCYE